MAPAESSGCRKKKMIAPLKTEEGLEGFCPIWGGVFKWRDPVVLAGCHSVEKQNGRFVL